MKLINVKTLELYEFVKDIPKYAILSHRWEAGEISFEEYMDPARRHGPGFEKIRNFCHFLRGFDFETHFEAVRMRVKWWTDTIQWCWVDTCCIDKRSSAELSESINSMSRWYQDSAFCVTYLADVRTPAHPDELRSALGKSEWFSRGWTLQELLFPPFVVFCDQRWAVLPDLPKFSPIISDITGVPVDCLRYRTPRDYSIACRMSWASFRTTTRPEDEAYCLLGLFDINMPLLYGEGRKAFQRLQEAIIRHSRDDSILAWSRLIHLEFSTLARLPSDFKRSGALTRHQRTPEKTYRLTDRGIAIEADAMSFRDKIDSTHFITIELDCHYYDHERRRPVAVMIALVEAPMASPGWVRYKESVAPAVLVDHLRSLCVCLGRRPRQTYLLPMSVDLGGVRAQGAPGDLFDSQEFYRDWVREGLPMGDAERSWAS